MDKFLIKKTNKDCYKLILQLTYPTKQQLESWLFVHKYKSSCSFMKNKFNLIKKCNCHICDIYYYGCIYNYYYIQIFKSFHSKYSLKYLKKKNFKENDVWNKHNLEKQSKNEKEIFENSFFVYLKHTKCLL